MKRPDLVSAAQRSDSDRLKYGSGDPAGRPRFCTHCKRKLPANRMGTIHQVCAKLKAKKGTR